MGRPRWLENAIVVRQAGEVSFLIDFGAMTDGIALEHLRINNRCPLCRLVLPDWQARADHLIQTHGWK